MRKIYERKIKIEKETNKYSPRWKLLLKETRYKKDKK
jgi:hypothetical protein